MKKGFLLFISICCLFSCDKPKPDSHQQILFKAFMSAVSDGDIEEVSNLISKGVDINGVDENGYSSLFIALRRKKRAIFEYLLKQGADPNVRIDNRTTLLSFSFLFNESSFLDLALKYGGDPNQEVEYMGNNKMSLLYYLIHLPLAHEGSNKLKILINHGADLKAKYHNLNAVAVCVNCNKYEFAYILLKAGAPYSTDSTQLSLLFLLKTKKMDFDDPEYVWRNKIVKFLQKKGSLSE